MIRRTGAGPLLAATLALSAIGCTVAGTPQDPASATPAVLPSASPLPTAPSTQPRPSGRADQSPANQPTLQLPSPAPGAVAARAPVATRVVIPAYGIDLPIVPGNTEVIGNPVGYPLCDVAQYLAAYRQPAEAGTTYLYAHARRGMFLPLLRASETNDDSLLVGTEVLVYTADGTLYHYDISVINRHATDYRIADMVRPGDRWLVLQTSEGPRGTVPKLQLGAGLLATSLATTTTANPTAKPSVCA